MARSASVCAAGALFTPMVDLMCTVGISIDLLFDSFSVSICTEMSLRTSCLGVVSF